MHGLVIASIDRAGDHASAVGVLALAGVVGWLIYLVVKSRGPGA